MCLGHIPLQGIAKLNGIGAEAINGGPKGTYDERTK
jgi:hypothetical protein